MERCERESTWYREIGEKMKLSDLGLVERGEVRDSTVMRIGRYEELPGPPGVMVISGPGLLARFMSGSMALLKLVSVLMTLTVLPLKAIWIPVFWMAA